MCKEIPHLPVVGRWKACKTIDNQTVFLCPKCSLPHTRHLISQTFWIHLKDGILTTVKPYNNQEGYFEVNPCVFAEAAENIYVALEEKRGKKMSSVKINLKPFNVPNFVLPIFRTGLRQDGLKEISGFPLSEIEPETLSDMCDEFRKSIFEKAGKKDPR